MSKLVDKEKVTMSQKISKQKKQIIEGSTALALTVNNLAPAVVSAYPITPQTHIVEYLAKLKADGKAKYEYVRAESEFAAASIVLGASATGLRTYSATSSQGLLLMTEVLYNIAGLRLPVVITCANRAISAPINIWNDHSDAMAVRDSGFIQLFAENNQEAIYQHILAYKLAEQLLLPVMPNIDGYTLTHLYEEVSVPSKTLISQYLPKYKAKKGTILDPKNPITIGGFFQPKDYALTREQLFTDIQNSQAVVKKEWQALSKHFSYQNKGNGLCEYFGKKNAKTVIIALGSVTGTIRQVIKDQKNSGLIKITCFRPFPAQDIEKLSKSAKNIIVIDRSISSGNYGPLATEVRSALFNTNKNIKNYIAGLGGCDIKEKDLKKIIRQADLKSTKAIFL